MALHYMSSTRKSKSKSRRRFDDEQIKLLETMFETEARPELRMKQQLAKKLGLQPRQVAIWFQNKRARSKSKQIEREYSMLKMSYDNLASKFESVKKENQSLLIQLQRLQKMTEQSGEEECDQEKGDPMPENEDRLDFQAYKQELDMPLNSDKIEKMDYLEEDDDVLNMANIADGCCLTSAGNRYNFETIEFLEWECQL